MAWAHIQGRLQERWAVISKEKIAFYTSITVACFFLLWGIYPFIAHRGYLTIHLPKAGNSHSILTPPTPIEGKHLFGIYVQDYAHLPITALPITLQGTMINPVDKKLSTAIISANGGQAKIYHTNQSLPVSAKIIAIHNNYCVIDHGGRLEKLVLPHTTLQNNPVQNGISTDSGLKVLS